MNATRKLGRTGLLVGRLGVSAGYGVPAAAVEGAFEQGVNYFYWGSVRRGGMRDALLNLAAHRDRIVLVVQSYTRVAGLMGWSLERALRTVRYDHADVLLLGLWNRALPPRILEAAIRLKERGLVRFLAVSTHERRLVPGIAAAGSPFDVVHFRYNAAHRGAEVDIFPHLAEAPEERAGTVSFTCTSWRQLLHPKRLAAGDKAPTAGDCYRFVLSRPEVDVCMTGPSTAAHMDEALQAWRSGTLGEDELAWMRRVGAAAG